MNKTLTRLRVLSQKQEDKGSPESRDTMHLMFYEALRRHLSDEVLDNTPDSALRGMYLRWIGEFYVTNSQEVRNRMIINSISLLPGLSMTYGEDLPAVDQPEKIVSLF